MTRLFGPWRGHITIPGWEEPVELIVETASTDALAPILAMLERCWADEATIGSRIADSLFDCYCFFKKIDIEEGGMTAADFEGFPEVCSPDDVYSACRPERMLVGDPIGCDEGNAYILVDVDWPNGHMLQVFYEINEAGMEYKHVELAG